MIHLINYWNGVIYLKPKKNTGTIFYSNKKGDEKEEEVSGK